MNFAVETGGSAGRDEGEADKVPTPRPARRRSLRDRANSGDLLLQESPETGIFMSPAMHRSRVVAGLASSRKSKEAPAASGRKSDGAGGGRGLTRQRSATWNARGNDKNTRHQTDGSRRRSATSIGGDNGGRKRTWSHTGIASQPAAEWAHLDAFQAMGSMFQQELYHEKSSGLVEVLVDRLRVPLLMILVGVLAAFAGMTVDYLSGSARMWRIDWTAARRDLPLEWAVYGATSLVLTLGMCAITHFVCPCASGGGVPEMKAVLSGASRPGLLSAQLVVVKITGVIVANAAGLSVGKEGPLIHVTCAMADILMSTPWFKKVRLNNMKRLEILACACAAGVAATFGSVFGGTLFSVEVTATAYMVDTLPATFLCAVVVAVVFWASGQGELFTLISDDTAQAEGFTGTDLFAWAMLGAVCGFVGAGFVWVLDALSQRRNFFTRKELGPSARKLRMFVVVALATLAVIPASFTEAVYFSSPDSTGRARFHPLIDSIYDQRHFGMSWHLIQLLLIKFWTTIFSVVQPLPVGLFSPIFVIGGLMGRIFGEVARWADHSVESLSINFQPWEFALIGSAAFSAGVTRAVSTAVIVFELSGENHLRLPLGVALMISYFIANRFTKGIYDALMDTNGTPHLEEVAPEDKNVPAEDVMISVDDIPCLSLGCTGKDASEVALQSQPGQVIPVVQSMEDKVLVGVVLWNDLAIALADYRRRGGSSINVNLAAPGALVPGVGSPETSSAAAAAWGEKFEWEEESVGPGQSEEGDEAEGLLWPALAGVAEAVRKRVGWFPRMRTAEASLLKELDRQRAETSDGGESGAATRGGGGGNGGVSFGERDVNMPLSPLGEGIPFVASPWNHGGGGGGGDGAEASPLQHPSTGKSSSSLSGSALQTRGHSPPSSGNGSAVGGGVRRSSLRAAAAVPPPPLLLTAIEKAKRAPLRFYLVREGNKFVGVGRQASSKGAWKELQEPMSAPGDGIPIVLDPSPYQVTHTTELSKVDIAFRLLRLDNAYVCNAGRLVGVITRDSLAAYVDERSVSPMDDCVRFCGALACCIPGKSRRCSSDSSDDGKGGRRGSRRQASAAAAMAAPDGTLRPRHLNSGSEDSIGRAGGVDSGNGEKAIEAAAEAIAKAGSRLLTGGRRGGMRGYSALGDSEDLLRERREAEEGGSGSGGGGRRRRGEWDLV